MELVGGAYAARSVIANAQKCQNLFPEPNREDGPKTMTHYQRPGLRSLQVAPKPAIGRGLYRASTGQGFCVIGQNVYQIGTNFTLTQIGTLNVNRSNLVSMIDNGITLWLVDGSQLGYSYPLNGGGVFGPVVDPTGIFTGSIKVDYIDTFMLWALLNSQQFGSTLSNELVFNATFTAAKTGYPDQLVTLYVNRHEILLLGSLKSEIWYDAGNPLFPFAILPGAYIEWGCLAPYSVASADVDVFWLAQGLQGVGLVIRQRGYETKVISNYAISYAIQQMARNGANLSDAIGYTYTRDGHIFYVLTFVSGDQTWVYDESVGDPKLAWSQRGWSDLNGQLHRERIVSHAFLNGLNVGQDWANGTLYSLDPDYFFDYVDPADGQGPRAMPIQYTRTFPQIFMGMQGGQPRFADEYTIRIKRFVADIETGTGPLDANGQPPSASLRWSFNRGKSYGNAVLQDIGAQGNFETEPKWNPLGLGRYPILELSYSFGAQAALNGGWVDAEILHQ
jgi:hypothetical protein